MKIRSIVSAALVFTLLLSGCDSAVQNGSSGSNSSSRSNGSSESNGSGSSASSGVETEEKTPELTLEQKVGQLFIIRPDVLDSETYTAEQCNDVKAEGATEVNDAIRANIKKYQVVGVCQFSKNILNPDQITKFNADLQSASDIPMFIAVDEEGGSVARLANTETFDLPKYESAAAVGEKGTDAAYKMGNTIGNYVKKYGFNIDFAPDADVNTNPNNPVIGTRAFSSDAAKAAELAKSAGKGIADAGVIPTFKHFPGHGDTAEDSHTGFAYSYRTLEEIKGCELLPFEAASEVGQHAIMVSHISMPNVTGDDTPATLSEQIVGLIPDADHTLIITDSLSMEAITDTYSSGEAAVKAFQAGCDVLLMPYDFVEAYDAVLAACKDGTISMERLDKSVNKILSYKAGFDNGK